MCWVCSYAALDTFCYVSDVFMYSLDVIILLPSALARGIGSWTVAEGLVASIVCMYVCMYVCLSRFWNVIMFW